MRCIITVPSPETVRDRRPPKACDRLASNLPPAFLETIEGTALSTWIRDSSSIFGFWFIISFHALGMSLLVGASIIIALRLLGVGRELPLPILNRLYPIVWAGFWIQIVSGILLLIAYPTKSLTAPVFYSKLAFIATAMVVMVRLRKTLPSGIDDAPVAPGMQSLASWSLVLWFSAITAGRLIAYTAKYATYP
jgi:hypothetical protein